MERKTKTGDLKANFIMRQYKLDKMAIFIKIKPINPKLKQSEIARELKISSSTLKRYRREINMLSSDRIPPSLNAHTRKQKTPNHTKHDLKMTSNLPQTKQLNIRQIN